MSTKENSANPLWMDSKHPDYDRVWDKYQDARTKQGAMQSNFMSGHII